MKKLLKETVSNIINHLGVLYSYQDFIFLTHGVLESTGLEFFDLLYIYTLFLLILYCHNQDPREILLFTLFLRTSTNCVLFIKLSSIAFLLKLRLSYTIYEPLNCHHQFV